MKIISFGWTVEPLLYRTKTVTRRTWNFKYAQMFKPGDICLAYDKSPRVGGKPIAKIKINKIYQEQLKDMPDADVQNEGGLWSSKTDFIKKCFDGKRNLWVFVIRFEVIEII